LEAHVVSQLGFPWNQKVREASLCQDIDGVLYHRLAPTNTKLPSRLDEHLSHNFEGLVRLVRRLRPSVLFAASDYRNCLLGLELRKTFNLPVFYGVRGFWEETWVSKHGPEAAETEAYLWRRERELQCMMAAERVVTLAEVMKEQMIERGVPSEKIAIIPNAVDTERFVPVERDGELAAKLGIAEAEVVLGYISSFSVYEGIKYLIEATAKLIGKGHKVKCLLVGDGDEMNNLQAQAGALEIADRVIFTGRVPHAQVLSYYSLIDIFVVPRTADRVSQLVTPLKPYEAMATERVVAVSAVDALKEMVKDQETGLVFRAEDSEHLADVIEPLLCYRERREQLGRAAREWVCANRTWKQNAQKFLELYQSL
jgi:glycosyltransferase involved in cell wall biosynthesis